MTRVFYLGLALAAATFAADLETGKRLFEEKKYPEAEKTLREVVGAEPDGTDANFYLGMSLVELSKYKEAEPFLEKAAASKPEARIGLGRAYMMEDRLDDALHTLDLAQADLDAAAKDQAEKARSLEAETGEVSRYRGMILLKQNKFDDAYKQLTKAVELDPMEPYSYYYLGMASSRLKKPDQMVKNFQMFLKLAPNAPEAPKVKSLLKAL